MAHLRLYFRVTECKWLVTKTPPLLKLKCAISFLGTLINFFGNYNVDPFVSYTTEKFFTRIEWSNNCFDLTHKPFNLFIESPYLPFSLLRMTGCFITVDCKSIMDTSSECIGTFNGAFAIRILNRQILPLFT